MIPQILIALTGVVAIWLTQSPNPRHRRWACVFGLIGQPFWFWAAWSASQWGIFTLCFFYAFAWLRGIKTNWLKGTP
jgi:hypothetical protein